MGALVPSLVGLLLLACSSSAADRRELRLRSPSITGPSSPATPPGNHTTILSSLLPLSSHTGRLPVPALPHVRPAAESVSGLVPSAPASPAAPPRPASNSTNTTTNVTALPANSKDDGQYFGDWYTARATNYGSPADGGSIMKGSCEYYNLWGNLATGWDIAAMSDRNWGYYGSCGVCYEVKCEPMWVRDGYGQTMDRTGVCYDTSASVVVMITDTCPCYYPGNSYSNTRWCCGDEQHFDLSVWTFQKLADLELGVIGLSVRQVPCGYQVQQQAWMQPWAVYPEGYNDIPTNWKDRRPWPYNTPATVTLD